jgi:hypothetical protein
MLNIGFAYRQRMNRRDNQRKGHRSSVKIRYYLLVKKDNSILISLLGSILKKSITGTAMTSSSSSSSTRAPRIDAAQRKSVPTSGTILLVLTFALWFSRFIGSHQLSQGNLVTIVITSLLAKKSCLSAPNLHGTPPPVLHWPLLCS